VSVAVPLSQWEALRAAVAVASVVAEAQEEGEGVPLAVAQAEGGAVGDCEAVLLLQAVVVSVVEAVTVPLAVEEAECVLEKVGRGEAETEALGDSDSCGSAVSSASARMSARSGSIAAMQHCTAGSWGWVSKHRCTAAAPRRKAQDARPPW
jgi:hypothetical protein